MRIFPSLIAADQLKLPDIVKELQPYIDGFHCDIMDCTFVPNQGMSPDSLATIRTITNRPLWVHLMVAQPAEYMRFLSCLYAGDIISVHYESICTEVAHLDYPLRPAIRPPAFTLLRELLMHIQSQGWKASMALKPSTPCSVITPFIPYLDHLLLMTVEPGFSGQKMLPDAYERFGQAMALRRTIGATFSIGIDGGVTQETLKQFTRIPDDVVVGSALFTAANMITAIQTLRDL